MSKLEDKAVDIMDKAMVGAERLTEKLADLAAQYGPDVIEAGLQVARFTAAQPLVYGVVGAIASSIMAYSSILIWRSRNAYLKEKKAAGAGYVDAFGYELAAVFNSGAALIIGAHAVFSLLNVWNWIGLIEPKLWIAHRILEKAL